MSAEMIFRLRKSEKGYYTRLLLSQCINFPGMRKIPSNKNVKEKGPSKASIIDSFFPSRHSHEIIH